jgi:hypothetical protein
MSDCIADMFAQVGGWDTSLPFGWDCVTDRLEDGFHFAQRDDEQANITSTTSSKSSEEQIGAQFNDNSAQDNETPELQEQVNEEPVKTFEEVMQQAWTEPQEQKVAPQTGQEEAVSIDSQKIDSQDHAQQKGFFNKWVIGGLAVGTVAVAAVITAFFKKS